MKNIGKLVQKYKKPLVISVILLPMIILAIVWRKQINHIVIANMIISVLLLGVCCLYCLHISGKKAAIICLLSCTVILVWLLCLYRSDPCFILLSLIITPLFLLHNLDRTNLLRKQNIVKWALTIAVIAVNFLVCDFCNLHIILFPIIPVAIVYLSKIIAEFKRRHQSLDKYFILQKEYKVTAIIPNYNYARYLHERIESILSQTYKVAEIIILDDCSTDNSLKIIQKEITYLKANYPDIKLSFVPNEINSGNVFRQWEKAFLEASGDYIWICEADDLCSKHFLNVVMKKFAADPDVILSYTESLTIDQDGKKIMNNLRSWIDLFHTGHWCKDYIKNGKQELSEVLCINNTIANVSGVVFKKDGSIPFCEYLKEAQKFTLAGDWYFYSKVLLHGKIAYDAESLNYHRMHSDGVTLTTDNFVHYSEIVAVQNSIKNDIKLPKTALDKINIRNNNWRRDFGISDDELYYDGKMLSQLAKEKKVKDKVLLSVIVPVYNTEKYIDKCLKSIFRKLPDKTEVIIINDGSTDNSEAVIQKYIKNHPEIIYIKQQNKGLSAVKNVGIKIAKGKYVVFLDSDDYIRSNMYDVMLKKAIDANADIVYCDVVTLNDDGGNLEIHTMRNIAHQDPLMQILDNNMMPTSNNKLIKRELYDQVGFPTNINNEDVAVTPVLLAMSNRTEYINSPLYYYVQRQGSIQNGTFNVKRLNIFDAVEYCLNHLKKLRQKDYEKVEGALLSQQIISLLIFVIVDLSPKDRNKYIKIFSDRYAALSINQENQYLMKYLHRWHIPNLQEYLMNKEYNEIHKYIRVGRTKEFLISKLKRISL